MWGDNPNRPASKLPKEDYGNPSDDPPYVKPQPRQRSPKSKGGRRLLKSEIPPNPYPYGTFGNRFQFSYFCTANTEQEVIKELFGTNVSYFVLLRALDDDVDTPDGRHLWTFHARTPDYMTTSEFVNFTGGRVNPDGVEATFVTV